MSLSKFFELLLKSRIFSLTADLIFQFFVGEAWGERRIIFWKFKENQNFVFLLCLHVCELLYIVSFVVKSPSGGKNPWKTAPANPRRSLFEKCFKSWFDTVRWWEMSCAFEIFRNYWFRCILRRVMAIFRQQKNFGPNVRYCVFGYHEKQLFLHCKLRG